MTATTARHYQARLLGWLARLPLLSAATLAAIAGGINPIEVGRALDALRDGGWLLRLPEASGAAAGEQPPAAAGPCYALSPAALAGLRADPDAARAVIGPFSLWQASTLSVAAAIVAGPVSTTINSALARIAEAIATAGTGSLCYASQRSLPYWRHRSVADPLRPALRVGHAEARWRSGRRETRFALHVDRPGVPRVLKGAYLSSWRRRHGQPGPEAHAAILVICPGWEQVCEWEQIWRRQAQRHGRDMLPRLALARARDALSGYDLDDAIWFRPDSATADHRLLSVLSWLDAPAPEPEPARAAAGARRVGPPGSALPAFLAEARAPASGTAVLQAAAASLAVEAPQWRILTMLASQPWLSSADIATIQQVGRTATVRRLEALERCNAVRRARDPAREERWALSAQGTLLITARAGALHWRGRFARYSGLPRSAADADGALPSAHAAGVARCAALLAAAVRREDLVARAWMDERTWLHAVSAAAPVPDGALTIHDPVRGGDVAVLLEYERVQRSGDYGPRKIAAWIDWFREERWHPRFGVPPLVLIVAGRDSARQREGALWRALSAAPSSIPLLGAPEATLATYGLGGSWRAPGGARASPISYLARQLDP